MNSELVKTHKKVGWYPKKFEASITISISGSKKLTQFQDEKEFFFHSLESHPDEWRLILSFSGDSVGVGVERKVKTPIEVSDGECIVSFAESDCDKIEQECAKGLIDSTDDMDNFFELETMIEFDDHEGEIEISFRVAYSAPYADEDVIYCRLPTIERLSTHISTAYEDLFRMGIASDITFVVSDEEIKAHEAILSARIPYFAKMMNSGMVEAQTKRVKIDDADPESFKRMLKYVYCGKLPEGLDTSADKLLPLADQFDLPDLRDACLHWLEKGLSKENVCDTLIAADLYRCPDLKKKCLERLNQWKMSMDEGVMNVLLSYPKLLMELVRTG